MSLARRCAAQFENRTRSRGRGYAEADAVAIQDFHDDGADAEVAGSASAPYEVCIDWSDEEDGVLRAGCNCPHYDDGHLCKHIWATLLSIDAACGNDSFPGAALTVERLEDDDLDVDSYLDEDDSLEDESDLDFDDAEYEEQPAGRLDEPMRMLSLDAASPRRTSTQDVAARDKLPDWATPFRELHRHTFAEQLAVPWDEIGRRRSRAWYVLDVGQSASSSNITIDLFYQEQKKNGDYGKMKRLKYDANMAGSFADPVDRELLSQLLACAGDDDNRYGYYQAYRGYGGRANVSSLQLPTSMHQFLLPRLAATGRFLWMLDTSQPLEQGNQIHWDSAEPWRFRVKLTADDTVEKWKLNGEFYRSSETLSVSDLVGVACEGMLLTQTHLSHFQSDVPSAWISWVMKHAPIAIPYQHRDMFLKLLWAAPSLPPAAWPDNLAVQQIVEPPQPCLRVHGERSTHQRDLLTADVLFRYGDIMVNPNARTSGFPEQAGEDGAIERVRVRDLESERARIQELNNLPTVNYDHDRREQGTLRFKKRVLTDLVDQLLMAGWQVEAEGKQFRSPGEFRIDVQSGIDWFDLDATIDFGGVAAQLPDLLNAVRRGEKFVELGDGSRGILPDEWLKQYTGLAELGETTEGKVRFKRSQALLLDALLAEQKNLHVDESFKAYRERLYSFDGLTPQDAPRTFVGTLREYQRDGLGWFKFLDDLRVGGCLADDMGLGKTIQVLALLEAQRTRRLKKDETRTSSLVVAPKSLIFNWIDEAQRFAPRLRVVNYTGIGRKQLATELDEAHLILTTYGTLVRDIVELKERRFDFAILDEAQAIKNSSSQAAKACLLLQSNRRLALTGTPIENHLGELWSLFEFLNPGMLGRSRAFAAVCKNVQNDDKTALRNLSNAIAPFVLRRTKEQVLTELPAKTEQTLFCELLPKERHAYNELRDFYRAKLSNVIDQQGLRQSKIHVLEALLRLRQAACHRGLIDATKTNSPSAKLETLLEQLEEIIGEGHKALVFSQFTSLLAIVRDRLDKRSIQYEYLDGSTRNRKQIVDRFQQPDGCKVFLISLKAGGQGLNLTEADYVFILDPWWNPAVEMQAIDRVHRIGQTQPVFAYRIIARDTVEAKVLELQENKRELANAIITANDSIIRQLTAEDLQQILS